MGPSDDPREQNRWDMPYFRFWADRADAYQAEQYLRANAAAGNVCGVRLDIDEQVAYVATLVHGAEEGVTWSWFGERGNQQRDVSIIRAVLKLPVAFMMAGASASEPVSSISRWKARPTGPSTTGVPAQ